MNALCSAVQAYLVDGSDVHLRAAQNGFDMVRSTQSFATGGWGPDETFRVPGSGAMGESLVKTHSSFETPCGSYGHFKITRYLMRITGNSLYGDSMEAVLYNTILGAKPILPDGTSFYYADYNTSATKFYHQDKWPCCSGTFPQVTADYGISSYFRAPDGVYVNLYVPSQLRWQQNNTAVALTQNTQYPYHPETTLSLKLDRPETFVIYLRVPAWAGPGTRVAVNGKTASVVLKPGSFAALRQQWNDGDRIEFSLDRPVRLSIIDPQHPNLVAVLQGPLTLFAVGDLPADLTRAQLLATAQPGANEWQVATSAGSLKMMPYPAITSETYRLYLPVTT